MRICLIVKMLQAEKPWHIFAHFAITGKCLASNRQKKKSRFLLRKRLLEGFLRKSDLLDYEDIRKNIKKNSREFFTTKHTKGDYFVLLEFTALACLDSVYLFQILLRFYFSGVLPGYPR